MPKRVKIIVTDRIKFVAEVPPSGRLQKLFDSIAQTTVVNFKYKLPPFVLSTHDSFKIFSNQSVNILEDNEVLRVTACNEQDKFYISGFSDKPKKETKREKEKYQLNEDVDAIKRAKLELLNEEKVRKKVFKQPVVTKEKLMPLLTNMNEPLEDVKEEQKKPKDVLVEKPVGKSKDNKYASSQTKDLKNKKTKQLEKEDGKESVVTHNVPENASKEEKTADIAVKEKIIEDKDFEKIVVKEDKDPEKIVVKEDKLLKKEKLTKNEKAKVDKKEDKLKKETTTKKKTTVEKSNVDEVVNAFEKEPAVKKNKPFKYEDYKDAIENISSQPELTKTEAKNTNEIMNDMKKLKELKKTEEKEKPIDFVDPRALKQKQKKQE